MTKLTASMVVDLKDNTGPGARSAMRNLRTMKREGDMLARDLDRQMLDRVRRRDEMMRHASETSRLLALGVVATGVVAGKAFTDFAALERRVNRIAINAGVGADKVKPIIENLQTVAKDTHMGFDQTVEGLETLIASGRTLEDGLTFLPAVAMTAQASGAAIKDVALSADALSGSLKISAKDMQAAFDILVEGGKQGKFELKDMSQYLPSLLPLFSQIGYEGTKDLKKIVAMLQLVRNKAGTASEANTYLSNVVSKMFSNETNTKFKKFGVNLQKELRKAKDEGKDVMETFLDLTDSVLTKNKLEPGQLFSDMEFQRGVLALMSQRDALKKLVAQLDKAGGSTMKDFQQAIGDTQGAIDKMAASWDKLWTKVGQNVAVGAVPAIDAVNRWLDNNDAYGEGLRKTTGGDRDLAAEQQREFAKQHKARHPDIGPEGYKVAYEQILREIGRGTAKSVFDVFRREDLAKQYRDAQYVPGKGANTADGEQPSRPTLVLDKKGRLPVIPDDRVPVPGERPRPPTKAEIEADRIMERRRRREGRIGEAYRYGTGRETIGDADRLLAEEEARKRAYEREIGEVSRRRQQFEADTAPHGTTPSLNNVFGEKPKDPNAGFDLRRWWLGRASDRDFSLRDALGVQNNADGSQSRDRANAANAQAAGDMIRSFFEQVQRAATEVVESTRGDLNQRATDASERRQSFERETGPRWGMDPQPNALQSITGQVSITGTPTVVVANPPQPNVYNVSASVVVNEAADGAEVARKFASSLKTAISGTHADMTHQAHA